jgi:hypothetical protein
MKYACVIKLKICPWSGLQKHNAFAYGHGLTRPASYPVCPVPRVLSALQEPTNCVSGSPKFEDAMMNAAKVIKKAKEIS